MFVRTVAGCTRLAGLMLVALAVATAQDKAGPSSVGAPATSCQGSSAADFAGLRVFRGAAPVTLVSGCGGSGATAEACSTQELDPAKPSDYQGDLIVPGATQGAWTCAMVGGWAGWVPTDRLAPVPAAPAITTRQWLGTWVNTHVGTGRDRLVLSRSAAGRGRIHVAGKAYYTNAAHNVSSGELSGEALAMGPFLHVVDGSYSPGCVLDLTYDVTSETFRAVDNQHCGGFNVSFDGVWRRTAAKR